MKFGDLWWESTIFGTSLEFFWQKSAFWWFFGKKAPIWWFWVILFAKKHQFGIFWQKMAIYGGIWRQSNQFFRRGCRMTGMATSSSLHFLHKMCKNCVNFFFLLCKIFAKYLHFSNLHTNFFPREESVSPIKNVHKIF